jgi:hypothetical protein
MTDASTNEETDATITRAEEVAHRASETADYLNRLIQLGGDDEWIVELQRLKQVLAVVVALALETTISDRSHGPFPPLLPVSEVETIDGFILRLRSLALELPARPSPRDIATLISFRQQLVFELTTAIKGIQSKTPNEDSQFLATLTINLANLAATEVLSDAVAVSQAKIAQQETAGEVAESELAKEFAAYGSRQEWAGLIWLFGAIVLFGFTVVVALTVLKQVAQPFDWYSLATHLLIALPCLGFGAYCARESSRHRELAQWARRLAVQLKSVGAYTARLNDSSRLTLLAEFGRYIFGPHQPGKDDNQVQPVPPEIWKAVADVIRSRGDANV